jgi:branched-chain amino acid transport system substrate-binding protein
MLGRLRRPLPLIVVAALGAASVAPASASEPPPLRIGALYPLQGPEAAAAGEELLGVQIAADLINQGGGVDGRQVQLVEQDLSSTAATAAAAAVARLRDAGVPAIIGTYSSSLSIPASAAADADGMVYWEAGAVADQVTGRGLPLVFRVGATGANLGTNSAYFTATELAPRLGLTPSTTRVAVVDGNDPYGESVAAGVLGEARVMGLDVAGVITYDVYDVSMAQVVSQVATLRPDVIVLADYVGDGVAFREAMLAAHLQVGALIGSTMAECGPDFGALLGPDAVGVFASDRPGAGFQPQTLNPAALRAYTRFAAAWTQGTGRAPDEEGLAGFASAWALFADVLPHAPSLDPAGIAAAARASDLPPDSLPNGAGLEFSRDAATLGQNRRAAAVIWQWQAVDHSVVVWPPGYATGQPEFVPLPVGAAVSGR